MKKDDVVAMTVNERARALVGDMPWVTEHLTNEQIADLRKQIATSMLAALVQNSCNVETGGANLEVDDVTDKPYWSLWGEGWKDGEDMNPGEPLQMLPTAFPPGTRIVVIEPQNETTDKFYENIVSPDGPDEWEAIGDRCTKCGAEGHVVFKVRDDDEEYHCQSCNQTWFVDGIDS